MLCCLLFIVTDYCWTIHHLLVENKHIHTDDSLALLTFDTNEHELVVRQRAVVGHDFGGLDAAQADLAEVLLAGEAGQGHIGQVCLGVFGHFDGKGIKEVTSAQLDGQELDCWTVFFRYCKDEHSLTPLHLDPLGLHRGYVQPLLCVDLPDVVAGG